MMAIGNAGDLMNGTMLMTHGGRLACRLVEATRVDCRWRTPLLCGFVLCLICGCGDDTKFRPKVGGGLKRDTGDEPTSSSSVPPSAGSTAIPTAVATTDVGAQSQPPEMNTPGPTNPTSTNPPGTQAAAFPLPRRASVQRARRSRADSTSLASQMQLECNGRLLIRPLVLKPLLHVAGRKTVWLLTSSPDEERARGPAVCVRFETDSNETENLLGRPWSGQLFVQTADARQIFGTSLEGEVRIEFSAWDEERVEGRILPGELQSATGEKSVPYEGTFTATTQVSAAPEGESE